MADTTLRVALISETFFDVDATNSLRSTLLLAKEQGAELAVLPEIPMNRWSPWCREPRDSDAEVVGGPRYHMLAQAARDLRIGLVGGLILKDDGVRRNTALFFDESGAEIGRFAKIHLPEEPGFWETSHYEAGTDLSPVVQFRGWGIGMQICSDLNRPEGCHILGAQGAQAVVGPRSTERATYPRWKTVLLANALTSGLFVLSVNRPRAEHDVLIGGASIACSPLGQVLLETEDTVGVVELKKSDYEKAQLAYPGYLAVQSHLYAEAWSGISPRDIRRN